MVYRDNMSIDHRERTPTQQQQPHPQHHVRPPPDTARHPQSAAQVAHVQFFPSSTPAVQTQSKAPQDMSETSAVLPSAPRRSNLPPPSSIGSSLQHYPASPFQHNNYQGSYTTSQPPPFPNMPPQTYSYTHAHGYTPHLPLEPGQYPQPLGFRPMIQAHSPLEVGRQFLPPGSSAMYPTAHGAPAHSPLAPPPDASGSHSTPYTNQQFQPLHYPSPGTPYHYNHAYQPNPYHWYYGPPVSPGFTEAPPMHYRPPYFSPQQHSPPYDLEKHFSQVSIPGAPTSPEQPIAPSAAPSAKRPSQASTPASASPATSTHPERHARPPSPINTSSRPHSEHPLVRRPYHPNPPAHRSDWVMWVGNVPDDTTHDELWRFLKRPSSPVSEPSEPVDGGVSSIFLISRSNCAFVNYDTEQSLQRAIIRFNGQQLRPHEWRCPRLVCRARRKEDDLRAGVGGQRGMGVHTRYIRDQKQMEKQEKAPSDDELSSPVDCQSGFQSESGRAMAVSSDEETRTGLSMRPGQCARAPSGSSYASTNSSFLSRYFPKRFFILKSLTQFDLDLSVENGLWATQKHNETILDQAYRTSSEVILIFGVNKSGEFYGYARMAGRISQGERRVSWASHTDSLPSSLSSPSSKQQAKRDPDSSSPLVDTNQAFFTPSEHRLVEESPLPVTPSTGGLTSSKPSPAVPHRASAPAAVGYHPHREFSAEPPAPKFSLGATGKVKRVAGLLSKDFASPAPNIVLDHNAPVRAVRNKGSSDDTKTGAPALQPVQEENNSISSGDGDGDGGEEKVNEDTKPTTTDNAGNDGRQTWGQAFKVEWICTDRLPFHRIRHLRNPWNHDREIKVSRDGTELEPGVGQQLVEQWETLVTAPTAVETSKPAISLNERAVKSTPAISSKAGK